MMILPRYRYRAGATVRVTTVDEYSWCGRVLHPDSTDNAKLGIVLCSTVRCPLLDGTGASNEFYLVALTPYRPDPEDRLNPTKALSNLLSGKVREFVDYELEPI